MTLKEQKANEYVSNNANILNTEDDIRKAYEQGWDNAISNVIKFLQNNLSASYRVVLEDKSMSKDQFMNLLFYGK